MNITGIRNLAVCGALLGGIGAAVLGVGSGLAYADPAVPARVTHQVVSSDRGDQEVVPRDHPIPIHGDDSGPGATFHKPGLTHAAPSAGVGQINTTRHGG
ncbi:hypothetical protein CIW47_14095 [Mycolicibacterium sp. P1-5]|nr:hypothetical protein CIW47_14095 [Mycolicibacterium sp. P1-5]